MWKHLFPSIWQFRVSPDASFLVVMALSVSAEVDGVGVYVDVHEVVHDFTLDVVLHPVYQETAADVDDLDEWQAPVGQGKKRNTESETICKTQGKRRDMLYFWYRLNILIFSSSTNTHIRILEENQNMNNCSSSLQKTIQNWVSGSIPR